jgi:hypothetical protein
LDIGEKVARVGFADASQLDGENLLQWHARVRSLFIRAYPNEAAGAEDNVHLIDKFIVGCGDEAVKEYTHLQGPATYAAALTAAHNQAATKSVLAASRAGMSTAYKANRGKTGQGLFALNGGYQPGFQQKELDSRIKACYFCKDPSHLRDACELFKQAKEMANAAARAAGATHLAASGRPGRGGGAGGGARTGGGGGGAAKKFVPGGKKATPGWFAKKGARTAVAAALAMCEDEEEEEGEETPTSSGYSGN